MFDMFVVLLVCITTMLISLILTPIFKKLALRWGIIDEPEPEARRIHEKRMPTMGGIAIYVSFYLAVFFLLPVPDSQRIPLFAASSLIVVTGVAG
ncbi:MAG: hypothetical protein U5K84_05145 [Alkalibacterium sp.]|nr:hypothetical protein [Alkalibacterium sp.]